jgi:hypothetical protein
MLHRVLREETLSFRWIEATSVLTNCQGACL